MKGIVIRLPYFKQGDDLENHLETSNTKEEALENFARAMEEAASMLREIKEVIAGKDVSFESMVHRFEIRGADSVIDELSSRELGVVMEEQEDEGCSDDNCGALGQL